MLHNATIHNATQSDWHLAEPFYSFLVMLSVINEDIQYKHYKQLENG